MSVYKETQVYRDEVDIKATFEINKSVGYEQMVFGWASIAVNADGSTPLDWQGDITTAEVIEEAAYNFVLHHRATGEEHVGGTVGRLVESVIFTKEKMHALGIPEGTVPEGWWVGFKVDCPIAWQRVLDGNHNMFSIQGTAKRRTL